MSTLMVLHARALLEVPNWVTAADAQRQSLGDLRDL